MGKVDAAKLMERHLVEAMNCGKLPGMHSSMLLPFHRHPEKKIMCSPQGYYLIDPQQTEIEISDEDGFRTISFSFPPDYLYQSTFGQMIRQGEAPVIKGHELNLHQQWEEYDLDRNLIDQNFIASPISILSGLAGFILTPEMKYNQINNKSQFIQSLGDIAKYCFLEDIHSELNYQKLSGINNENDLFRAFIDVLNKWLGPHSFEYFNETHEYFTDTTRQNAPFSWSATKQKVDFYLPVLAYLTENQHHHQLHKHRNYVARKKNMMEGLDRLFLLVFQNWQSARASSPLTRISDAELLREIQTRLPHWIIKTGGVYPELESIPQRQRQPSLIPENYFGKRGDHWIVQFKGQEIFNSISKYQGFDSICELLRNPCELISPIDLYFYLQSLGKTYNKGEKEIPEAENEKMMGEDLIQIFNEQYRSPEVLRSLKEEEKFQYLCNRWAMLNVIYTYPYRRKFSREWSAVKKQLDQIDIPDPLVLKRYEKDYESYKRSPVVRNMLKSIRDGIELVMTNCFSVKSPELYDYLSRALILKTMNDDMPFMFDPTRIKDSGVQHLHWVTQDLP